MKKWKVATSLIVIALVVAWYDFGRSDWSSIVVWTKPCPPDPMLISVIGGFVG